MTAERVWAREVAPGEFELLNAPWYAFDVAEGDVVWAVAPSFSPWPDSPAFRSVVRRGDNCNIRVIAHLSDDPAADVQSAMALFHGHGARSEGMTLGNRLFAMTVPPGADLAAIKRLLIEGEGDGRWAYEEGSITSEWAAL